MKEGDVRSISTFNSACMKPSVIHNTRLHECYLCSFSAVELEVVAGLEVDGHYTVCMLLDVTGQYLLRHIVVVQLMVAHGQVHVQCHHVPVWVWVWV